MIAQKDIHIILPAYNESTRLEEVLVGLQNKGYTNILLVNDGSDDKTSLIGRRLGIKVVDHFLNRGAGAAVQTGLDIARLNNWKYVAIMDADGQHDPNDLLAMLDCMDKNDADLVIASRFLKSAEGMPASRQFFNSIANTMTNLFCKSNYTDSQSGFRLLNRKAIERIRLRIDGFGFCSEMLLEAERMELHIKESPCKVIYSEYSLSKGQDLQNGISTALHFLWNVVLGNRG